MERQADLCFLAPLPHRHAGELRAVVRHAEWPAERVSAMTASSLAFQPM